MEAEIALKGTAAGITEAVQKGTLKSEQVLHVMIRRARTLGKEKVCAGRSSPQSYDTLLSRMCVKCDTPAKYRDGRVI